MPRLDQLSSDLPFVGREQELKLLDQSLIRAHRGRGSSWLIAGPAGIGKSRLLREVGHFAAHRGFKVHWAYGLRGSTLPAFSLLQLSYSLRSPGQVPPTSWAVEGASDSSALPNPGAIASRRAHPASVDIEILSLLQDLDRASLERPQTVIIDDLQYVDVESLRGLRLLIRQFHDRPVVFLLAVRTALGTRGIERVQAELGETLRSGSLRRRDLGPLTEPASLRLATTLAGHSFSIVGQLEGLKDLVRSGAGTPYFVLEITRAFVASRLPTSGRSPGQRERNRSPSPFREDLPRLPTLVRDTIAERYATVPAQVRQLLTMAAVLGFEFDAEAVGVGMHRSTGYVISRLDPLAAHGWPIRRVGEHPARYAFEHTLIHSFILDEAEEPSPSSLHRIIPWWATHRTEDRATESRLRNAVGDEEGAVQCLRVAVDEAIEHQAFRLAAGLLRDFSFRRGVDAAAERALVTTFCDTALKLRERWQWDSHRVVLEGLKRRPLPEEIRWKLRCWALDADAAHETLRVRCEVEKLSAELSISPRRTPREVDRLLAYLRALLAAYDGPDQATVTARLTRAARLLDDGLHDFELFRILTTGALVSSNWGRPQQAKEWVNRARAILDKERLPTEWLRELLRSAEWNIALRCGDCPRALNLVRGGVRRTRLLRNPSLEAGALLNQGICEFELRQLTHAEVSLRRAADLLLKLDERFGLAHALVAMGWCSVARADWLSARSTFEKSRDIATGNGWKFASWASSLGLAFVLASEGDPEGALALLPEAPAPGPDPRAFRTEYHCIRSRILELRGEVKASRAVLIASLREARHTQRLLDALEVLNHLAAWERRHGFWTEERKWRAQIRQVPLSKGSERFRVRSGIAMGTVADPVPRPLSSAGSNISVGGRSSANLRIVQFLDAQGVDHSHPSEANGLGGSTERELAAGVGLSRDSIARALGRFLVQGAVDRIAVRTAKDRRRLFVYRLAEPGLVRPPS